MKKFLSLLIIFSFLSLIAPKAAAEDEGPPLPIVEIFDTRFLEIVEDGKLFQGVFMPEEEFQKYTQLKIDYKFTKRSLEILEKNALGLQGLLDEHKKLELDILTGIKDVKELVVERSWWDDNKFYIGMGIGAIVTGLIIAGVQAL